jgi:hypothetical protein
MPTKRSLFPFSARSDHRSPYIYNSPRRRWWPMVAAFGVGWACAFVLPGSQPQPFGADTGHKSIAQKATPGGSIKASDLVVVPGRKVQAPADASPARDNAEDTLLTVAPAGLELEPAGAEAATASVRASIALPATTRDDAARATPARTRIHAARLIARPRHAFARLQTRGASHRRDTSRARAAHTYEITSDGFRVSVYGHNSRHARHHDDRYAGERYGSFGGVASGWFARAN